ncbi:MAG: methyl-accepting chemotaxis protein [Gammaproteobacteria bacterium]|uniref:methyl-accepting chemotaxis protein n=1 Tax=Rhodoferax sp. TaxID=50421 RepID=UPI0017B02A2A|nr:methyl-accepting chemotaxis protein [Rhodoferax sp.]MBU3898676.1 methyl-accepting chemotaxis protein [Gammaproteobacteria bacterium]MBA3057077.1 methyl-accepting chemotaxis protein [Rhodoferax sp.]MBU3998467.1 methyl-accepting chemotaxis protein [Gammaproteobacteria bacterium]MBU4019585.1 methyl-accepting chemotaxis protein [Gammaproteobacteria bacterium]MBU4079099.1 methyl-accepting chemotaxis protein [Gammaproteobacteria bacterium]
MKGMLDFLEKAGLVRKDAPAQQDATVSHSVPNAIPSPEVVTPMATPAAGATLKLDDIYANAGITGAVYPAERLLRLVDGLSAMDEATRAMAIKAMDAADESWTIDDPLTDASAKVRALGAHAEHLQFTLQALEAESQTRLDAVAARREQVVGDIRKQITELEALVARELTRAAQETATQEASLKAAKDQTARELEEISRFSQRLRGLAVQFGTPASTPQE